MGEKDGDTRRQGGKRGGTKSTPLPKSLPITFEEITILVEITYLNMEKLPESFDGDELEAERNRDVPFGGNREVPFGGNPLIPVDPTFDLIGIIQANYPTRRWRGESRDKFVPTQRDLRGCIDR